jgi:hypothetical protein
MTGLLSRLPHFGLTAGAVLLLCVLVTPASACPFCQAQGQTLTSEVNMASMVLFGTLHDATLTGNDGFEGTTTLTVEKVVKDNDWRKSQKNPTEIKLNRYIPPVDKNKPLKYLVFCDIYKGNIDPYRGIAVEPNSDLPKYLEGALKHKDEKPNTRLRFFFDYLDNTDSEVSTDAYKEFANAPYQDYREMAGHLPADRIAGWLTSEKTPAFRHGLYASMLGHCGKPEHADVLRKMLDDPLRRSGVGTDGILAGYVMLAPKEGWAYLSGILRDAKKDFSTRYAALRTVRFFWDLRPDLITQKDMIGALRPMLEQGDIADLAIEDLRKWKQWDLARDILALRDRKSHQVPIVQRAILRYALSCPQNPDAVALVDTLRKKDPRMVKDAEELLRLEIAVPKQ